MRELSASWGTANGLASTGVLEDKIQTNKNLQVNKMVANVQYVLRLSHSLDFITYTTLFISNTLCSVRHVVCHVMVT